MRRLIILLVVLFGLFVSFRLSASVVGSGVVVGPGVTLDVACNDCTGKVICQNFEGTGTDNGETWTKGGTTANVDFDATGVILRGAQSCSITNAGEAYSIHLGANLAEFWFHTMYQTAALSTGDHLDLIQIRDSADATFLTIRIRNVSPGPPVMQIKNGTIYSGNGTTTVAIDTVYHIWGYYKNDGHATVWLGTNTSRPASAEVTMTNGDSTASAHSVKLYRRSETMLEYFDQVLLDDAEFTTVCP